MTQGYPLPEKPKKKFCFAIIPLIPVLFASLYVSIVEFTDLPTDWQNLLGNTDYRYEISGDFIYLFSFLFIFIGTAFLIILLLAKVNNALLGVPMFVFSTAFLMLSAAQVVYAYDLTYGKEIIFDILSDALLERFPIILIINSLSFAFFVIALYIFIVTSLRKPPSKKLWIIPSVIFGIFYTPWIILSLVYLVETIYYYEFEAVKYLPEYLIDPLFPLAVILILLWISSPYKKNS